MNSSEEYLKTQLENRRESNALRQLTLDKLPLDFSSNDYLGFAKSEVLKTRIHNRAAELNNGSGGSRLLSGNSELAEETERLLAQQLSSESVLIFNSGYDANLGLISCIAKREDIILYDELVHASIRDGIRLSFAKSFSFLHNELNDLKKQLSKFKGRIYVIVESVYSMDGDVCPLYDLVLLKKQFDFNIIVDEAHAIGVIGQDYLGLTFDSTLRNEIFARVYTFGKAIGLHGAAVLGSTILRDYLINFSRPFIYSTAPTPNSYVSMQEAIKLLRESKELCEKLTQHIKLYNTLTGSTNESAIKTVVIPGNQNVRAKASELRALGFDVKAVLAPTVPEGKERIRICLHSYNNESDIRKLCSML